MSCLNNCIEFSFNCTSKDSKVDPKLIMIPSSSYSESKYRWLHISVNTSLGGFIMILLQNLNRSRMEARTRYRLAVIALLLNSTFFFGLLSLTGSVMWLHQVGGKWYHFVIQTTTVCSQGLCGGFRGNDLAGKLHGENWEWTWPESLSCCHSILKL